MATYGGIEASDVRTLPDTGNQLISFNIVALQSMMQAVAREVAERVSFLRFAVFLQRNSLHRAKITETFVCRYV